MIILLATLFSVSKTVASLTKKCFHLSLTFYCTSKLVRKCHVEVSVSRAPPKWLGQSLERTKRDTAIEKIMSRILSIRLPRCTMEVTDGLLFEPRAHRHHGSTRPAWGMVFCRVWSSPEARRSLLVSQAALDNVPVSSIFFSTIPCLQSMHRPLRLLIPSKAIGICCDQGCLVRPRCCLEVPGTLLR